MSCRQLHLTFNFSAIAGNLCEISQMTTTKLTTTTTTTGATTTTISVDSYCPININICFNGGQCLVFGGTFLYL